MPHSDKPLGPGAHAPLDDRLGTFARCAADLPTGPLVLLDERVDALHPSLARSVARLKPVATLRLRAGERLKQLSALRPVLEAGAALPRSGTLVAIGGGTLGDLAAVAAHLIKRGVRLVHVPTTTLAAIDSSVGGKGALHVGPAKDGAGVLSTRHAAPLQHIGPVKNGAGVFHYAWRTWLCPELFTTLSVRRRREGAVEAWKMAACLDVGVWRDLTDAPRELLTLGPCALDHIVAARQLKARICAQDPYETQGRREVLNFGHTFGHALESLTRFRLPHGEAVALGILCALDVGHAMGVTPTALRDEIEEAFTQRLGAPGRAALAKRLASGHVDALAAFLAEDKKTRAPGRLRMVLVRELGDAVVEPVEPRVWKRLAKRWSRGARP